MSEDVKEIEFTYKSDNKTITISNNCIEVKYMKKNSFLRRIFSGKNFSEIVETYPNVQKIISNEDYMNYIKEAWNNVQVECPFCKKPLPKKESFTKITNEDFVNATSEIKTALPTRKYS